MKKLLFLFLTIAFIGTSFAKDISPEKAKQIAKKAYFQRLNNYLTPTPFDQIIISEEYSIKENGETMYYIFNFENYGFLILSADDVMVPVLGYSLDRPYVQSEVSENFLGLMNNYVENIKYIKENQLVADNYVKTKWNNINNLDTENFSSSKAVVVDVLTHSTWNQDYPYNYFCPEDAAGPNGHVYAGCVATCMSQIMYYWRWPETGNGSSSYYAPGYGTQSVDYGNTTYDYNGMEDNSDSFASEEMAKLQYHAGVSVEMGYGADGSGAFSQDVDNAFRDYFRYSNSCQLLYKSSYTYTVWKGFVQDELDDACPMYYAGVSGDGGHAFVCDGYTDDDEFHFNFGWSGSANGWYTLYDVNGFSSNQQVVRNIFPSGSETYPTVWSGTKNVPHIRGVIEDGSGPIDNYENNTSKAWLIDPSLNGQMAQSITINILEMDIASGDELTIYDGADASAPVIGTFSGNTPPAAMTSTDAVVFITFESNASSTGEGFRIHYAATQEAACGSNIVLTEQEGEFTDGSGDSFDYVNGKNCSWKIEPQFGSQITINIDSFKTQEDEDHLTIYDGVTFTILDDFSGDVASGTHVYETPKLLATWKTDQIIADEGWVITYNSDIASTVNENSSIEAISLYPNPASEKLSVYFLTNNKQDISIKLYDIKGAPVYQESLSNFSGRYINSLDISKFSKGVYFIKIYTDTDVYTEKVVIK